MGTCLQFECQWARPKARYRAAAPRRLSARAESYTEPESDLESAWPRTLPGTALPAPGRTRGGVPRARRPPALRPLPAQQGAPGKFEAAPAGACHSVSLSAQWQPVPAGPARPTAGLPRGGGAGRPAGAAPLARGSGPGGAGACQCAEARARTRRGRRLRRRRGGTQGTPLGDAPRPRDGSSPEAR
jgi:hypothetical protein